VATPTTSALASPIRASRKWEHTSRKHKPRGRFDKEALKKKYL
jgi:hypothetical protein